MLLLKLRNSHTGGQSPEALFSAGTGSPIPGPVRDRGAPPRGVDVKQPLPRGRGSPFGHPGSRIPGFPGFPIPRSRRPPGSRGSWSPGPQGVPRASPGAGLPRSPDPRSGAPDPGLRRGFTSTPRGDPPVTSREGSRGPGVPEHPRPGVPGNQTMGPAGSQNPSFSPLREIPTAGPRREGLM